MFGIFKRCRDCYPEFIDRPYRDDLLFNTSWSNENMFELLLKGISEASHTECIASLLRHVQSIGYELETDYFKDNNLRDAAIDTICQILQQHKTQSPKQ